MRGYCFWGTARQGVQEDIMQSQFPLVSIPVTPTTLRSLVFAARAELTDIMQDSTMLSQKSLRWRRALSPRKASLPHEDWVLRGLTLHQLKDIITDVYASKAKADVR